MPEEKKKRYVNLAGTVKIKSSFKHERVPNMQKAADAFAERLFGIPLSKAKAEAICIECRKPVDVSRWDERERSEYEISGLCRGCQEIMFAQLDEDDE